MRSFVALIVLALAAPDGRPAQTSDTSVTVTLPHGVSVDVPGNWVILSNDQRVALNPLVPSRLDLSRVPLDASPVPFEAHLYDEAGHIIGMVSARYFPHLGISQTDARAVSTGELHQLDIELEKEVRRDLADSGMSVTSWRSTTRKDLNGLRVLASEYHRPSTGLEGDFRVRVLRAWADQRSFTLTVSYWEPQAHLLEPIADRIIGSLRMAGVARLPPG